MISAVNYSRPGKRGQRRGRKPVSTDLYDLSKMVADRMWEDAQKLAEALAPERPADAEELDEFDQFQILMTAAVNFSPGYWDDPDALEDLYRLKKRFTGRDDRELLEFAKLARAQRKSLPDPNITPQNPEWQDQLKRMKR